MIKGLQIAKAGMSSQANKLDVIANNLSNASSTGFKKSEVFFRYLSDAIAGTDDKGIKNLEIRTDFSNGPLQHTSNPFDLAIEGKGFFVLQTEDGEIYTRNGNFTLNDEGVLVTKEGYPVMGQGGEIQIVGEKVEVQKDGTISIDGEEAGRIRVVDFDNPQNLVHIGQTCFANEDEFPLDMDPEEVHLQQGYLEGSNVSGIDEIVQMIELYRQFEMGQKILTTQDQTLNKLINETGRLT